VTAPDHLAACLVTDCAGRDMIDRQPLAVELLTDADERRPMGLERLEYETERHPAPQADELRGLLEDLRRVEIEREAGI
jgi:hypothetical protein